MISSTSNFFDSEQSSAKHIAIKSSVRKVNLLAKMIKGLSVAEASLQLQFSKKKVAYDLKKVLNSAVANAENNFAIDIDKLYIASVLVGKAFVLKRLHARARGRAARISKPYSRVEIILKARG